LRLSRLKVRMALMALRAAPGQQANCTLIARTGLGAAADQQEALKLSGVSCGYVMERVTRIELALSAWEVCGAVLPRPADWLTCGLLGPCP
jgi:hypothetical protein